MKRKVLAAILTGTMVLSATACSSGNTAETRGYNSAPDYAATACDDGIAYEATEASEAYNTEQDFNTEEYNTIKENGFIDVLQSPLSTFAADVDTGTYCNLRRMINGGYNLDNIASAIRTEEMVNYFDYKVDKDNKLLIMTMQANSETTITSEGNNFVFLIDSSGSMSSQDKLPLVKDSFKLLAGQLGPNDRVSIVTYSGSSDTLLEGSNDYKKICNTLDKISASGGTNGSGGITAAYECATKNFIKGGNNRVIIASDGDMNLGITSQSGLVDLIKRKKETGVFLTVLGYGTGNYSDANMESIADAGNGNYFYIDSIDEAERVLCAKLMQTTVTVAKDVKFQVEFNPSEVVSYRQIGYENRQMAARDFNDDKKDGGEIGAGAQVTVCYELKMRDPNAPADDGLKYQDTVLSDKANNGEICTVSVRYKAPNEDESKLIQYPLVDKGISNQDDFNFICGVIEASLVLRNSEYKGTATYASAYELAKSGSINNKYREEFCDLIKKLK